MNAASRRAQPATRQEKSTLLLSRRAGVAVVRRGLPIILALLVLAVPAAAHATTYGAEVSSEFSDQAWGLMSSTQVIGSLKTLHAAGARVGRADSGWAGAEPKAPVRGRHVYNWSYDDTLIGEMAQARLRWMPDLDYAPRWAQGRRSNVVHTASGTFRATLPPADNANFGAYVTAFMRRYGPHGLFWRSNRALPYVPVTTVEVWNEPDNRRNWGSTINLANYARMYEVVRTAIHRVYRHATVATGGLAWTPTSLPRMLKAFRHKPLDAVAFHPYASTPKGTLAIARGAIAVMRRYGRGRTPLLANEYGWTWTPHTWGSTRRRNVDPYQYQALVELSKLHLAAVMPFLWAGASWGLNDGNYAKALAYIQRHHR